MNFDLLVPPPGFKGLGVCGQNICYHVVAFMIPFNQGQEGGYLLSFCCIHDSLLFDMQHDHVLKKLYFDPITRVGEGVGGVHGQHICYHVASLVIQFNLIWNMTMFWKKYFLPLTLPPGSERGEVLCAKYLLPCYYIHDSLKFNMQHDLVLQKLNFDH